MVFADSSKVDHIHSSIQGFLDGMTKKPKDGKVYIMG